MISYEESPDEYRAESIRRRKEVYEPNYEYYDRRLGRNTPERLRYPGTAKNDFLKRYPPKGDRPWDSAGPYQGPPVNNMTDRRREFLLDSGHGDPSHVPSVSRRTAFPGHPGYAEQGDFPRSVPGVITESEWLEGIPQGHDIYKEHRIGWKSISGERAAASPRFAAAIEQVNLEQLRAADNEGDGALANYLGSDSIASQHPAPVNDPEFDQHDLKKAQTYWKAHMDVQSGMYDHIEDPFEDAASSRNRNFSSSVPLNLSKEQFNPVRGFINPARD